MSLEKDMEWFEREKDLKDIQARVHKTLKDQQAINVTTYNMNDHLTNMRMGKVGNDVQVAAHKKLAEMANIFPKRPMPISVEDPMGKKNRWSKREIVETEENLRAFVDPHSIAIGVLQGNEMITNNQMDTIRSAYPELIKEILMHLISSLGSGKMELSEQHKLKLGLLIDTPISHRHSGEALNVAKYVHNKSMMRGRQNVMQGQSMNMAIIEGLQTNMQGSKV